MIFLMIDACKTQTLYTSEGEMNRVLYKSEFTPTESGFHKITGEPFQCFELRNLRIKAFFNSKRITVSNSLHKLKHGNNYCDFTFTELNETCNFLSDTFEKHPQNMHLKKFEFGLIVSTPYTPTFYLDSLLSHRLSPFYYREPPYNSTKPILKYCHHSQYNIKFYDTAKWNGIASNLLKYEIAFLKMNKAYEIIGRNDISNPITLSDFTQKSFLDRLAVFQLETYQMIHKQPIIDYSQLDQRKRDFLFAGTNPEYWKQEKKLNKNTAKKKRARYLQLIKALSCNSAKPYNELENLLKSKYSDLINR